MASHFPLLIQGGMGIAVSDWKLARSVSVAGHLGVVSGTALDSVMVRRLQLGDPGGHTRRALAHYPVPTVADSILDRYFIEGGKPANQRFIQTPMGCIAPSGNLLNLLVASNFVEVHLAREGHSGPVGVNYMEKIQAPLLASIYGSMLAGVDYVLVGAGIPRALPGLLDRLADGLPVDMRLDVKGASGDDHHECRFDPEEAMHGAAPTLERPMFLAIVSSHILATMLATKIDVPADGFIIEAPVAGGHNAPPRGRLQLSEAGEPVYGERDVPDMAAIRDLGLPFWLAGGYDAADQVREALELGATGVQVGTPFAFCEESGFDSDVKRRVLELSSNGTATVYTDPVASPSGYPFKVTDLEGTLSDPGVYAERQRERCELGYLRTAYQKDDGRLGWRCPAEPVEDYVRKGGNDDDAIGRKCLCNALLANVGLGQVQRGGATEKALFTSGDMVAGVERFLQPGETSYTAAEVIERLVPSS
ncbi:MAG: nitronate monooxygenase [Acidimicrobiales bacterium]|nr:nitronate monooxygenase [Acidimicrobiales bacterium]